jgi:amino acid transporter
LAAPDEAIAVPDLQGRVIDKGLKPGALGLTSSIVMGIASTAPAYSLAAALGYLVQTNGAHAPSLLLLAFVPMYCIAVGYQKLNELEPDCGTTFTWAAKVFRPWVGWMGGWGIIIADILVMANLGQVAGQYLFRLVNADGLAASTFWVTVAGCLWLAAMTWISYRGIEVSAKLQFVLLAVEVIALGLFAAVALFKSSTGDHLKGGSAPHASWLLPTHIGGASGLSAGLLIAAFAYWGWDTSVSANEETENPTKTPGRAAVISTFLLLATYALVAMAAEAYAGTGTKGAGLGNVDNGDDVLSKLGNDVLGSWFGHVLIFMVLTSAAASALTSIIPTARTSLAMAAHGALPRRFGRVNSLTSSPTYSTIAMGAISITLYVGLALAGTNLYNDAIGAVGLGIAFYYGMTGLSCAWAFRQDLAVGRLKDKVQRVLTPLFGGLVLTFLFVYGSYEYLQPASDASASYTDIFGLGAVGVIGLGSLLLGAVLMAWCWKRSPGFFRGETFAPDDARDVFPVHTDVSS